MSARVLVFALLAAVGCHSSSAPGLACRDFFGMVTTTIVNPAGAPVGGLVPQVLLAGQYRTVASPGLPSGEYAVVTDAQIPLLGPDQTGVRFAVHAAAGNAIGDFTIGFQDAAHCHVTKVSGPDTLVLQ